VTNGPRVLALTGLETGPVLWRVYQPYTELQRRGYGAWFRGKDDPEMDAPEWPYLAATRLEAICIPRFYWQDHAVSRQWVRTLHKAGLAVIYDLDDDALTPSFAARQQSTTEKDKSLSQLEQDRRDRIAAIRLCDGVTVSTPELAAVVRQYVETPVVVVPNRIDVRWWRQTIHGAKRQVPPLTVGWAGGARYPEDLEPVAEAWHNIAKRRADVRFVVQGHPADVLIDAIPRDRLSFVPWLELGEYPRGMKNIDIGCCSVADNHFNRCKTPIKLWEFTMAGAACAVSPTLYAPVASDGVDALVCDSAAEWEAALTRLIEDAGLRKNLWRAQRRRVATDHSLATHVLDWPKAWQRILTEHRTARQLAG
jgi:glycosyltransferase involved in cell wall biosynthesis